jgi:hypothetical protein
VWTVFGSFQCLDVPIKSSGVLRAVLSWQGLSSVDT